MDSNTITLLDKARRLVPRQSKGALCLALGIDRANVNRIYRGKGYPNALQTARLAKMLKLEAEEVAAMIAADKARSRGSAEDAKRSLPRISPAVSVALALVAGLFAQTPHSGKALAATVADVSRGMHYAPFWRRYFRRLSRRFTVAVSAPMLALASPLPLGHA